MFECLPKVDICGFNLSLRLATIYIAIAGIMGLFSLSIPLIFQPLCGHKTEDWQILLNGFVLLNIGSTYLLSLLGLIFLIAIAMDKTNTIATLFLIAIVQFLIVQLATMIAIIVVIIVDKDCLKIHSFYSSVLAFPVWIYFMIVVRSYQDDIE